MSKSIEITQSELAQIFGKSQTWISRHQTREIDPLPRGDRLAAIAWGQRLGLISASSDLFTESGRTVNPSIEQVELRLKSNRADLLEIEKGQRQENLMSRQEVEEREVAAGAHFRRIACEYPVRARAIIERHIMDAALVETIMEQLQPLAADLLNAVPGAHADASR